MVKEVVKGLWVSVVTWAGIVVYDVEAVKVCFVVGVIGEELGDREGEFGGVDEVTEVAVGGKECLGVKGAGGVFVEGL